MHCVAFLANRKSFTKWLANQVITAKTKIPLNPYSLCPLLGEKLVLDRIELEKAVS
jgi:hypothetical protein